MSVIRAFANALFGLTVVISVVGCTRHLTNNALPGEYLASGAWGTSTLFLHPDGTFQQEIIMRGGAPKRIEGVWMMLDSNTEAYTRSILFKPFMNMWVGHIGQEIPNANYAVESRGLHGVWIDVDLAAGTTYEKQ